MSILCDVLGNTKTKKEEVSPLTNHHLPVQTLSIRIHLHTLVKEHLKVHQARFPRASLVPQIPYRSTESTTCTCSNDKLSLIDLRRILEATTAFSHSSDVITCLQDE